MLFNFASDLPATHGTTVSLPLGPVPLLFPCAPDLLATPDLLAMPMALQCQCHRLLCACSSIVLQIFWPSTLLAKVFVKKVSFQSLQRGLLATGSSVPRVVHAQPARSCPSPGNDPLVLKITGTVLNVAEDAV